MSLRDAMNFGSESVVLPIVPMWALSLPGCMLIKSNRTRCLNKVLWHNAWTCCGERASSSVLHSWVERCITCWNPIHLHCGFKPQNVIHTVHSCLGLWKMQAILLLWCAQNLLHHQTWQPSAAVSICSAETCHNSQIFKMTEGLSVLLWSSSEFHMHCSQEAASTMCRPLRATFLLTLAGTPSMMQCDCKMIVSDRCYFVNFFEIWLWWGPRLGSIWDIFSYRFHANSWGLVFAAPLHGAALVLPGELKPSWAYESSIICANLNAKAQLPSCCMVFVDPEKLVAKAWKTSLRLIVRLYI